MAGVYRPRHPERTVLYRMLFHYFDRFLAEYESRFEKEYGFFRPIIKEVVECYLDCGNPRCGFARIRCPDCQAERLLMFSCRTRGFCPSCHAKRLEEWGEWMREELLLDVPHRQVVFTIPRMLRIFFRYNRRLLGSLCRSALRSMSCYMEVVTGSKLRPGIIASIQTFGTRMNPHPHLHFLVTEGGAMILGAIFRGEMVGEMAILSGEKRTATVCAVRDSDLVRLTKTDFEEISKAYPRVSLTIMRILVNRLKERDRTPRRDRAFNIALVPAGPQVPLADFSRRLFGALSCSDKAVLLNSRTLGEPLRLHDLMDQLSSRIHHLSLIALTYSEGVEAGSSVAGRTNAAYKRSLAAVRPM